ncbi:DUF881 domain-containing protein [Nakamurella sp. YIM 132087]|uniref:DUF881 domain-containing protein n=1 Tax=Nakamurella alba TaxID=2665158 RepID=A0A7K1FKS0_9ACTN|nr:DUF881 domain-containing protein [Nakamurella alba]MTD14747.1 DUF881 domain-containing protein [Nakamurella alba]
MRRSAPASGRASTARGWQLAGVGVCLVGGVLLGTTRAWSQDTEVRDRSVDLAGLVGDAQARVTAAESTAASLQQAVAGQAASDLAPQVGRAREQAAGLEAAAGLTAVHGPGLRVSLDDAPRDQDGNYPEGVDPDDLVVHQQDVQAVVNALWAGGAEAMMIMDQRVVTTSAVRCIGNTLLLQGRTYSPPFLITAIGDADRMGAALAVQPGVLLFQQYVDGFGLGYQVETMDDVTLPAYGGLLRMTAARESG